MDHAITTLRLLASAALLCAAAMGAAHAQTGPDLPPATVGGSCAAVDYELARLTDQARIDPIIRVSEDGRAIAATPVAPVEDAELLRAVINAALSCKYLAAMAAGRPTAGTARAVYPFSQAKAAPPLGKPPGISDPGARAPTERDDPETSRRLSETGTTRIQFTVDHKGRLTAFGVVKSSGSLRLDFAALFKLAGCRFEPGRTADGRTTSASFDGEYVWALGR